MKVRVPGTSANLGAGFDVLGMALNIYNEVEFSRAESESLCIDPIFEGGLDENLIYQSYKKIFEKFKEDLIPVKIIAKSEIPMSRGLGSSSACIVAGVVGAYLIMGREIDRTEILKYASEIEGHPDNVAPCIMGGLVASTFVEDEVISLKVPIKNDYKLLGLIPNLEISTQESRKVLPTTISLRDGVFNSSRVAILLTALVTGQDENIKYGFEDKFHQKYRGKLIPGYFEIINFLKEKNIIGTYLSGAGPTIMVLVNKNENKVKNDIEAYLKRFNVKWKVKELYIDNLGFEII